MLNSPTLWDRVTRSSVEPTRRCLRGGTTQGGARGPLVTLASPVEDQSGFCDTKRAALRLPSEGFCQVRHPSRSNKAGVALMEPFKSLSVPGALHQHAVATATFSPSRLVGCCLGRTRCLQTVQHKRLCVFRVVSLNSERLCHESSERKGRSVCVSQCL